MKIPGQRYHLIAILALAFVVRFVTTFFLTPAKDYYTNDSHHYMRMAAAILSDSPVAAFPNGYPLFIAFHKLALPAAWVDPALLFFNVCAGTALVYLTYLLGRLLTGKENYALICALVIALYPHQINYATKILTEILCSLLITTALYLFLRGLPSLKSKADTNKEDAEDRYLLDQFLAGFLLHVASAVRPSGTLILPALILLALIFRQPRKGILCFCAGILLSLLIFTASDKLGFTRPPATAANNALISIASDSRDVQWIQYSKEEQKNAWKTYLQFAVKNPARFLQQRLLAFWELWGFWSLAKGNGGLAVRFVIAVRSFLFVLWLIALWRHRRNYAVWAMSIPIIVLTLIHTMTFGNHRFNAPIEPFLFLLAGIPVAEFLACRRKEPPPLLVG